MAEGAAALRALLAEHPGPALLIGDAPNRVEQDVLATCIDEALAGVDGAERVTRVFIDLHGSGQPPAVDGLQAQLNAPSDLLLAPLRVVWAIPGLGRQDDSGQQPNGGRPLALRHLLIGDPRQPGSLMARWIRLHDPGRARCMAGATATLGELAGKFAAERHLSAADQPREFAGFVAHQAALALELAEWRQIGRRYKAPRFVNEQLRSSPKFRAAVARLAADTGRKEAELYHEADGYMKELASTPSPLFIDLRARLDNLMVSLGYNRNIAYDEADLERLREVLQTRPALLLFTHKTYMDGPALMSTLFARDFPMLHAFGGLNMSFAGLGLLFRRSGGIFIRRSFRDKPLYKLVLRHYIGFLMEKRFPLTWAFEGTRSRTGKLMPPRYGLLKYVLEAAQATGTQDINVVPVAVSYDLMRDVEDYASEQTGRPKQPESLKWFVGYLSSLRRPMGRMYLNFGEPVVLEQPPDPEDSIALSKILFEVAVRANRVTPITLPAIGCLVLMGAAPRALTLHELQVEILRLLRWAQDHGIALSSDFSTERLSQVEELVEAMVAMGLWLRYDAGSDVVFGIEPAEHPAASYYRNTIVHHFVNKAIVELALLGAAEAEPADAAAAFRTEVERLRDYFKFEFFYPEKAEFFGQLTDELHRIDPQWEQHVSAGRGAALELLRSMRPLVAHASLLQFAEAYSVVFETLARAPAGVALEESACVNQALTDGRQAYLQRRITSEASIGKALFANAYRLADNLGLCQAVDGAQGEELRSRRMRMVGEFRGLCRQLQQIRLMALPTEAWTAPPGDEAHGGAAELSQ